MPSGESVAASLLGDEVSEKGSDNIDLRRDLEGSIQLHPELVAAVVRDIAEGVEKPPFENAESNSDFSFELRAGNMVGLRHPLRNRPSVALPSSTSPDTELTNERNPFALWKMIERSHPIRWQPGALFYVNVRCPERIEGTFFFSFEFDDERFELHAQCSFRADDLYILTTWFPRAFYLSFDDVQVRVYAGDPTQSSQGESYFVIGTVSKKVWL